MQLSDQSVSKIVARFQGRACDICGNASWSYDARAYEIREFHGTDFVVGAGSIVPLVTVTCSVCGNTKLFNPIVTGVLKPDGSPA